VVFTRSGCDEYVIHRRIVAAVTLGLLVLPIGFILWKGWSALAVALLLSSLAPAAALLWVRDRKAAVEGMLWLVSGYLFLVVVDCTWVEELQRMLPYNRLTGASSQQFRTVPVLSPLVNGIPCQHDK